MTWVSMVALPDPRVRDPAHQARLRAAAHHRGTAELIRAITINSYRDLDWARPGACAAPSLRGLFFPQYAGDPMDPNTNMKVELDRATRLKGARAVCVGDDSRPACPMWASCLSWRFRVGGQDKVSFAAGLSWRSYRDMAAAVRRIASTAPSTTTELVAC